MTKPPRLKPGDTIGIVSPSWGGAGRFPHRTNAGIRQLEALGFTIRLAPCALHQNGFVSDTPENRAGDIHLMFADPEVKGIIAAIGGDHSCHLLPLLNFDLIRENPKVFIGYSDITVLNVAIWQQTGLVTFNGPALLTDFAEYPHIPEYTEEYFRKAVTSADPAGEIQPSTCWTEEFLDWGTQQDRRRPRQWLPSPGWTWLKTGHAEGRLLGGCIESLQHLRGTPFWPDWEDTILFIETSEDHPPPETVDGILMDYQNMGIFDKLRGMLVGRPMRYTEQDKQSLRQVILERTASFEFPVITDMDFGHTSPQLTLPLGCRAEIDSTAQQFTLLEAAVC